MSTLMASRIHPLPTFSPLRRRRDMAAWLARALEWDRRARDRARLARMLPCHLDDMGLTAELVAAECTKPFWRA